MNRSELALGTPLAELNTSDCEATRWSNLKFGIVEISLVFIVFLDINFGTV